MKGLPTDECLIEQTPADYIPELIKDKKVHFTLTYHDGKIVSRQANDSDSKTIKKSGAEENRTVDEGSETSDSVTIDSEDDDSTLYKVVGNEQVPDLSDSLNLDMLVWQCVELSQDPTLRKLNFLDELARYDDHY